MQLPPREVVVRDNGTSAVASLLRDGFHAAAVPNVLFLFLSGRRVVVQLRSPEQFGASCLRLKKDTILARVAGRACFEFGGRGGGAGSDGPAERAQRRHGQGARRVPARGPGGLLQRRRAVPGACYLQQLTSTCLRGRGRVDLLSV